MQEPDSEGPEVDTYWQGIDLLALMRNRRSIRKYQNRPVEFEKIGLILEAGKAAPSAGNVQNWKFVVVIDKGVIGKISEACLQQYWMNTAACHIVIVAYPQQAARYYGIRGERLYTIQNCAAVAENILLMAHYLGLGACWVGAFDEDMLKGAVNILPEYRPQMVISVGYPDETPPEPSEYTMENLLYLNKFKGGVSVIKDISEPWGVYSIKVEKAVRAYYDKLKQATGIGQKKSQSIIHQLSERGKKVHEKLQQKKK